MGSFLRKWHKEFLTLATVSVIAAIYFGLNYFVRFTSKVYTSLGFAFEKAIPLIPVAVPLYLTVYFVYLTPFFFIFNKKKYVRVMQAYLFVVLMSGLVYVTIPVKVTWEPFIVRSFVDHFIVFLRNMNLPYCALPSMHVSLAYLATFVVASENRKWGYFLAVAATLITFSTLFTKQHYVVDLLTGFLLGLFAYVAFVKKR